MVGLLASFQSSVISLQSSVLSFQQHQPKTILHPSPIRHGVERGNLQLLGVVARPPAFGVRGSYRANATNAGLRRAQLCESVTTNPQRSPDRRAALCAIRHLRIGN